MVHLFDMLRLLIRYLGNFCQITANLIMKAISFFSLTLYKCTKKHDSNLREVACSESPMSKRHIKHENNKDCCNPTKLIPSGTNGVASPTI